MPRKTPTPRSAAKQPRTSDPHPASNLRDTWVAVAQILTQVKATDRLLREPLTDTLSHFLAGQYAIAIDSAVRQAGADHINPQTLAAFASDVAALRKGDQNAARLRIERHRVGLEYKRLRLARQNSHEKWKTKISIAMDAFKTHLSDHPEATAAFVAFAKQVCDPFSIPPETLPNPENPAQSD